MHSSFRGETKKIITLVVSIITWGLSAAKCISVVMIHIKCQMQGLGGRETQIPSRFLSEVLKRNQPVYTLL